MRTLLPLVLWVQYFLQETQPEQCADFIEDPGWIDLAPVLSSLFAKKRRLCSTFLAF
jgi:hypothetical protein